MKKKEKKEMTRRDESGIRQSLSQEDDLDNRNFSRPSGKENESRVRPRDPARCLGRARNSSTRRNEIKVLRNRKFSVT